MTEKSCSDDEFIRLFTSKGATETAKIIGCTERSVYKRGANMARYPPIVAPSQQPVNFPGRLPIEIKNGEVLVGSDFHIWPDSIPSTCLRAFKQFCADIKPQAVILNGDVLDLPRVSRHPQTWARAPDPQEEIEAAQDHLNDLVQACKRGAHKIWTQGNHDIRFDQFIANAAPQYRG